MRCGCGDVCWYQAMDDTPCEGSVGPVARVVDIVAALYEHAIHTCAVHKDRALQYNPPCDSCAYDEVGWDDEENHG
jgi:hypothetical protein